MINLYKKVKGRKRVSFHLGACSLFLLIFSIISKSIGFIIAFSLVFLTCLFIYIFSRKKIIEIEECVKNECLKCGKTVKKGVEIKYSLYGEMVSEDVISSDFSTDKKKYVVEKYFCENCKICFTIVKTFQMNSRQDYVLIKTDTNFDEDYSFDY